MRSVMGAVMGPASSIPTNPITGILCATANAVGLGTEGDAEACQYPSSSNVPTTNAFKGGLIMAGFPSFSAMLGILY